VGRKKRKKKKKKKSKKRAKKKADEAPGPVQLSKFMKERRQKEEAHRSAVSGKKIKLKIKKSSKDKEREKNRKELLHFLNQTL